LRFRRARFSCRLRFCGLSTGPGRRAAVGLPVPCARPRRPGARRRPAARVPGAARPGLPGAGAGPGLRADHLPPGRTPTLAWWDDVTLGLDLGIAEAPRDAVYEAMDWLLAARTRSRRGWPGGTCAKAASRCSTCPRPGWRQPLRAGRPRVLPACTRYGASAKSNPRRRNTTTHRLEAG
jgi:hypothetical protein